MPSFLKDINSWNFFLLVNKQKILEEVFSRFLEVVLTIKLGFHGLQLGLKLKFNATSLYELNFKTNLLVCKQNCIELIV